MGVFIYMARLQSVGVLPFMARFYSLGFLL